MEHNELNGVYNCSAPNPVTNEILMTAIRENTNTKFGLPSPTWLLKIGAVIVKTETELILKSRWVVPKKLLEAGFIFKYPILDLAVQNIIAQNDQGLTSCHHCCIAYMMILMPNLVLSSARNRLLRKS
jgi:hypothetical protein